MPDETKPDAHEKQKHTPKGRGKLTVKERKFANARLAGADLKEASVAAGYSPFRQQGYRVERQIAEKAPEVLNRIGLTIERFARKLEQLLDAKEIKHFAHKGIVLDTKEVEALDIQARAVDIGLRAHGAYKQTEDGRDKVQPQAHAVCLVVADERRAAEIARLLSDSGSTGVVIDVDAEVDENLG